MSIFEIWVRTDRWLADFIVKERGFEMDFGKINSVHMAEYQNFGMVKKSNATNKAEFARQLNKVEETTKRTDDYKDYLKSKYGNVRIESVGKDQRSLDKIGGTMSGNDVVIAPNILGQMADNPEKAKYYEGKIDNFFENVVPRETANFAAKGLTFESGGVVVHKDGTVTYISGCSDSPERVAEVEAINREKAAHRKEQMEYDQKMVRERQLQMSEFYQKQNVEIILQKCSSLV